MTVTTWDGPKITLDVARDLLVRARDTQPAGFRYSAGPGTVCINVPATTEIIEDLALDDPRRITGCLIGTALTLHGVDLIARDCATGTVTGLSMYIDGLFDDNFTVEYLAEAQMAQDRGATWHAAVEQADELLGTEGEAEYRARIAAGMPHMTYKYNP